MALDYHDEHDQILNPAKCAKCGGGISLNIKPVDDTVWDEHDLPAKGDKFNPAIYRWSHSAMREGSGGVPLPPGRVERAKARLADFSHPITPHDGRTMEQESTSMTNAQDPVRSRARGIRRSNKIREDAEFDMLTRNSGMMSKQEQAQSDAERKELLTNGFLQRDARGTSLDNLNKKQFGTTPKE
jgi:hypothetical protein